MSEDRLLGALNTSESVKENEKNFDDTESTRNEDYDADEILKTTMPDRTKINKKIREIRKKIMMNTKNLETRGFCWIQKKITINNNYIQYESIGGKDKNLLIKEDIDIIGHTIAIKFIYSKDFDEIPPCIQKVIIQKL